MDGVCEVVWRLDGNEPRGGLREGWRQVCTLLPHVRCFAAARIRSCASTHGVSITANSCAGHVQLMASVALACKGALNARLVTGVGFSFISFFHLVAGPRLMAGPCPRWRHLSRPPRGPPAPQWPRACPRLAPASACRPQPLPSAANHLSTACTHRTAGRSQCGCIKGRARRRRRWARAAAAASVVSGDPCTHAIRGLGLQCMLSGFRPAPNTCCMGQWQPVAKPTLLSPSRKDVCACRMLC
jgi:hypothetical protein